ncbi:MAG: uracil-DNA glycosylase [Actinobacteria bacterium]|nr:uracil-DNA glycosylase [Actinomycetota bacterium]
MDSLKAVGQDISQCHLCPRLVQWREQVAVEKRASFCDDTYWGRGVPGFGDPHASLWVVGLAPAAHGANRTGRMFTGDRSGDWLYRAMHKAGFASQAESTGLDDGLELHNAWVSSIVRCAPPDNKPTNEERDTCVQYFTRELALLKNVQVIVCLGKFAYDAVCKEFVVSPRPKFGHGIEATTENGMHIICSFHPSQQNTFTGKLTEPMIDDVFSRARNYAE